MDDGYDYVYVKKTYRNQDIHSKEYVKLSAYLKFMLDANGLNYNPFAPFKIPTDYHCFNVVDKGKALCFCIKNGNFILKPDK